MGPEDAAAMLLPGANGLGGTLMNETFTSPTSGDVDGQFFNLSQRL